MTTPWQLDGSMPPSVTSSELQAAASTFATQVSMSDCVLTTAAEQAPAQQELTPDCTHAAI